MSLPKGRRAQVASRSFSFPKSPVVNASATDVAPNVVSGCDILVSRGKGKRRVRFASAWTSGEFDFDVFLRPPGGRADVLCAVSSTRPRWGRQRCRRVHVPMCFSYTPCIHKLLPLVLVASAFAKCVHRVGGGPMSQFTAQAVTRFV